MGTFTLNILKQIAAGLAAQFGENCEVVVHDLTKDATKSSIVYIENGHITGRETGDRLPESVLSAIHHKSNHLPDKLAYLTKTEDGHILKSSMIYIHDEAQQTIDYIFSINYDITNILTLEKSLHSLTGTPEKESETNSNDSSSKIPHNVNTLLDELIEQSVALVGTPAPLMNKDEKIKAINFLNNSGAFLITKSGDKIAKYFGISKYTLYSYVDINK